MSKRRKKKEKKSSGGGGGWITTYSDLMSLLLAFFVLLYSMSNVSESKFSAASQSIQNAFMGEASGESILDGGAIQDGEGIEDGTEEVIAEEVVTTNTIPPEVLEMYEEAVAFIEAEGLESDVAISGDQDGIYLDIQESILFETGQADVTGAGEDTLSVIIELLNLTDNNIVVEGYTDDVPINQPRYPSNWELSVARAVSVVRYLAEGDLGVEPERLSAKGYGEHSPIVPNDSPENKAKNRRVNIIIVYEAEEGNS